MKAQEGDIVVTRKSHPCGNNRWEVVRTGCDVKIRCLKCGRTVMLDLQAFEKAVKRIEEK